MSASTPAAGLRERHKQQRRERILEAIRELLRECPDETPTVERIAELADLSPATVFNLVGPRERQLAALSDALLRELDACLALAAEEDPREQARRIVDETAELFIADAAVSRYLVNSGGRSGALLQENPIPQLRAALRRGQASGMLRPDLHVEALVGHIATAAGGALRQWAAGQISDAAFRTRVRFAVDVVFAASASEDRAAELVTPLQRKRRRGSR
ncbi:MAG TPA: TetR/AcrR family transcriptional regulator [Solirubrobacteraceae bacterium]|jgi:AcrR family transcriptional regulator|nr:TetR/AcrR family transcriptional regulator [Solirubrobacteraceae bacterium]